jgi:SAM-dependent methyltransferase
VPWRRTTTAIAPGRRRRRWTGSCPTRVGRVVDLGAGTGALTRLLAARADEVVAVEPDERMRSVLIEEVPGVRALAGRGESIPLPDSWADAVTASSSWHWMDLVPTLVEVGRVLVAGGDARGLVVRTGPGGLVHGRGPGPPGRELVGRRRRRRRGGGMARGPGELAGLILGDGSRPEPTLEIPPGVPFTQPDHEMFRWDVALNADELIGLLGTFSWIITMPEDEPGTGDGRCPTAASGPSRRRGRRHGRRDVAVRSLAGPPP